MEVKFWLVISVLLMLKTKYISNSHGVVMYKVGLTFNTLDFTFENGVELTEEFAIWLQENTTAPYKLHKDMTQDGISAGRMCYTIDVYMMFESKDDALNCKLTWG